MVSATGNENDPLPKASGGSVVDGTYIITAETQYEHDAAGHNSYIICGGELNDIQGTY